MASYGDGKYPIPLDLFNLSLIVNLIMRFFTFLACQFFESPATNQLATSSVLNKWRHEFRAGDGVYHGSTNTPPHHNYLLILPPPLSLFHFLILPVGEN